MGVQGGDLVTTYSMSIKGYEIVLSILTESLDEKKILR